MNCPLCKETIESSVLRRLPTVAQEHGLTVRAVAYCCPKCDGILGAESHPLERDAQMLQLVKDSAEHARLMEEMTRRIRSLSASLPELLKQASPPPPAQTN